MRITNLILFPIIWAQFGQNLGAKIRQKIGENEISDLQRRIFDGHHKGEKYFSKSGKPKFDRLTWLIRKYLKIKDAITSGYRPKETKFQKYFLKYFRHYFHKLGQQKYNFCYPMCTKFKNSIKKISE